MKCNKNIICVPKPIWQRFQINENLQTVTDLSISNFKWLSGAVHNLRLNKRFKLKWFFKKPISMQNKLGLNKYL